MYDKEYAKKWREKNKKEIQRYQRKYFQDNKKHLLKSSRAWARKNRERQNEFNKKCYIKNKDKRRSYRAANKSKHDEYMKTWLKDNKAYFAQWRSAYRKKKYYTEDSYRVMVRLRSRLLAAFRLYSLNGKVATAKDYGIDYNKIFEHLGACPGNHKEYHIDHIKPLCRFDFNDPKQIKKAFAPKNHQWLLAKENLRKGKKYSVKAVKPSPLLS